MSAVEERLREALHARADAEPVAVPARFVPTARRLQLRRRLLIGGLALAAAATGGLLAARPPHHVPQHVTSQGPDQPPTVPTTSPLPRVILDVDAMRPVMADERVSSGNSPGGPGYDGFHLQSFRTPDGLRGPLLWVLSMPPAPDGRNDYGIGVGERVTVQGTTSWLQSAANSFRLVWPQADGSATLVSAYGLTRADVLAVAGALEARPPGWNATVLPLGLAPAVDSDRRAPSEGRAASLNYNGSDASAFVSVSTAGPTSFDDLVMNVVLSSSIEVATVVGQPALLVHESGRGDSWSAYWAPTPTTMAIVRLNGFDHDQALAAIAQVRILDEAAWVERLPPSAIRPADVGAAAAVLEAGTSLPDGRMWSEFPTPPAARDRALLARDVLTFATCAWNDEFKRTGSPAAIAAIEGSAAWPSAAASAFPDGGTSRGKALADQMRTNGGISGCR